MSADVARGEQSRTLWLVAAGASLVVLLAAVGVLVWAVSSDSEPEPSGRTAIVLAPVDDTTDVDEETLDTVRRGAALLGYPDASVEKEDGNRLTVELPDEDDPVEIVERLVRPGTLGLHAVEDVEPPGTPITTTDSASGDPIVLTDVDAEEILRLSEAAVTTESFGLATAESTESFDDRWAVTVDFQGEGQRQWADLTGDVACEAPGDPARRIAVVLDDAIVASPQVDPSVACGTGITGGSFQITGNFDKQQARALAAAIGAATLPVELTVVEERPVTVSENTTPVVVGLGVVIVMAAGTFVACIVLGRRAARSGT